MHRTRFEITGVPNGRGSPLALLLCLAMAACGGGNGAGLDVNGRPLGENTDTTEASNGGNGSGHATESSFDTLQRTVFTPDCASSGCHSGTASPLGLNLAKGQAWSHLVGKPSSQASGLQLVEPSNPEASYLMHKLLGTQSGGLQMPLARPPLEQDKIEQVRQWILAGAPESGADSSDTEDSDTTSPDTDAQGSTTQGSTTQGSTNGTGGGDGDGDGADNPPESVSDEPTLSSIQARIFDARCDGCHDNSTRASGGLSLVQGKSYSQLAGRATADGTAVLVQPGSAEDSLLIDKLTGENLGNPGEPGYRGLRMPVVGGFLSAEDVDLVRRWIDAGALDD